MDAWLCTLDQMKQELKTVLANDPDYLARLIPVVSREIENACFANFEPIPEVRFVYPNKMTISPDYSILKLRDPETQERMYFSELLEVTKGEDVLVADDDVEGYPLGTQPQWRIRHLGSASGCYTGWHRNANCTLSYGRREPYKVDVEAVWVYRERYATEGWQLSGSNIDEVMDAGEEDVAITGRISDYGIDGLTPRFSVGNLLRIGSEYVRVIGVVPDTAPLDTPDVLQLKRGVNGTTDAAHTSGTPIYVWSPQPEVNRAAVRWASLMYERRGVFKSGEVTDIGFLKYPSDMPDDVRGLLERFLK